VKELRELTGLGMMECKKALAEAGGDLKKAEELLRIKSGAKASKAAGRVAAEGVIGAYLSADAKTGSLVELNCETDFVAKNDDFVAFAQVLAELVATKNPGDVCRADRHPGVETQRQALVQKIGENITIRAFLAAADESRSSRSTCTAGASACWSTTKARTRWARRRHAHLLLQARVSHQGRVPADDRGARARHPRARAKESGKPAEIVAKMVDGGLNKFLAEPRCSASRSSRTTSRRREDARGEEDQAAGLPFPGRRRRHREEVEPTSRPRCMSHGEALTP
jgi:elongation factor Ts